jgi:methyl-accepting chemotaxis protein
MTTFPKGDQMTNRWKPLRDEQGQAATFSVVLVVVTVLLAAALVWQISDLASRINRKAGKIQQTAVPINRATDAVTNIPETNRLASSILTSAKPLEGQLAEIIRLAKDVDRLAASINGTAGTIDGTAKSIDAEGARILPVARAIDADVRQINANLDGSIGRAGAIDGDTSNILGLANTAHRSAACIDRKVGTVPVVGRGGGDSHC